MRSTGVLCASVGGAPSPSLLPASELTIDLGPNELSIHDPAVIAQLLGPSGMPKTRGMSFSVHS